MLKSVLVRQIWSTILPLNCLGCGAESDWLCPECRRGLKFQVNEICFCGRAATDGLCSLHREQLGLDGLTTLWSHREPAVRELIHALKHRGHTDSVSWLSQYYQRAVLTRLPRGDWAVTAIPLSKLRMRQRGFNQSELLAKKLTSPVYEYQELLLRRRDTKPQEGRKRSKRQNNMVRAFALKSGMEVPEQIILVDDFITTGTTLASAAKVLRRAGVHKVWALTIAQG